jgi:hypothetical protein
LLFYHALLVFHDLLLTAHYSVVAYLFCFTFSQKNELNAAAVLLLCCCCVVVVVVVVVVIVIS